MTLKVYKKGVAHDYITEFNFDVPTNPRITTSSDSPSSTISATDGRLFGAVYKDGSEVGTYDEIKSSAGFVEYNNLTNTEGYRIKCFDYASNTGIQLDTVLDLEARYYFVLVHSDDENLHHFAKITSINKEDVDGASFDFTPKLGNSIPKDTKFMLFKGPPITRTVEQLCTTTNTDATLTHADTSKLTVGMTITGEGIPANTTISSITDSISLEMSNAATASTINNSITFSGNTNAVAFTAGIKKELQTTMYCSKPLFYFIDDELDKKNELNHNTKYMFRFRGAAVTSSTSSVTLDSHTTTFATCSDFGSTLIDYSKFETKIKITDKLREADYVPASTSIRFNETSGTTNNSFAGTYSSSFPNARVIDDDDYTSFNTLGHRRYLHYDYSKTISNLIPNVYQGEIIQSNQNRGGIAESKIVDSFRIMPKKVVENDLFRVRQTVHTGSLNEWINTGLTLGTYDSSNNRYDFPYGISQSLLPTNTQVKIGNRICIIATIGTGYVTIDKSRLETESTFTTSLSLAQYQSIENQKLYVRSFDAENSILYSTFKPIEGRTDELYVKLSTNNVGIRYLKVTSIDTKDIFANADDLIQLSALTVSPVNTDAYDSKPFKYALGQYEISIERFYGNIENIHSTKEQGQTIMTITGRDRFAKLLNPIINKNTLFSTDIIYSSYSPMSDFENVSANMTHANYGSETITFASAVTLKKGDLLFVANTDAFIGEVLADYTSTTSIGLKAKSRYGNIVGGSITVKKLSKRQYILNKALSSNRLLESSTALDGAVDKVLSFTSGVKLEADGTEKLLDSGNANSTLEVLSSNSAVEDSSPESNAYYITEPKSIGLDSLHSLSLTETEDRTSEKEDFITVNTLMDFTVLDYSKSDNGDNIVTIAPYNPLTLGRVDYNFHNTNDSTFHADILGTGTYAINTNYISLDSNFSTLLSYLSVNRAQHGAPVYSNDGDFLGHILYIEQSYNPNYVFVALDRKAKKSYANVDFKFISLNSSHTKTKLQHELNFINGSHLHGGKYVGLLNPFQDQDSDAFSASAFFDFRYSYDSASSDIEYKRRFKLPLYRLLNIENGNYAISNNNDSHDEIKKYTNYYHNVKTKINYYAEAYRGSNKSPFGFYASKLVESSGLDSVYGSKFHERPYNGSGESHPLVFFDENAYAYQTDESSAIRQQAIMTQFDPKVSRMFLFINSDILPYSNTRKDSLLQSNKDLRNYNIMGITEPESSDLSIDKSSALSEGTSVNYKDTNYVTAIPTETKDITTNKQFSLMRLTEVVYDWAYNQIDPENLPKLSETYPRIPYKPVEIHANLNGSSAFSTTAVGNYSGATISLSANPHSGGTDNLVAGDYIIDSNGRYIGEVSSSSSGNTITLVRDAIKTSAGDYYVGQLYKANVASSNSHIHGHGEVDSFNRFFWAIHPLKGTVVRGVDSGEYGHGSSSAFDEKYGSNLASNSAGHSLDTARMPQIFLPIQNNDANFMSESDANEVFSSRVLTDMNKMKNVFHTGGGAGTTVTIEDDLYAGCNLVFFKGYNIEDGGGTRVGEGMTTPKLENTFKLYNDNSSGSELGFITIRPNNHIFASFEDFHKQKARTYDNDASGVIMGFKPHLTLRNSTHATEINQDNINGNHTHTYTVDSQSTISNGRFLDYVDLTGCYLVDINGKYYDEDGSEATSSNVPNYNPDNIFYVLSHDIDTTATGTKHMLTLDGLLPTSSSYTFRIMQPNHTCFYPKSPNSINLNEVSPKYTKKAYSDEMYDNIFDYSIREKQANVTDYSGQGVMSMYVAIDINKHTDSNFVVIRDADKISQMLDTETEYKMCVSDGENSYKVGMKYVDSGDNIGHNLYFSEMKEINGVASISEYFNLSHNGDLSDCKRLMIGSTLDIAYEAEALVNDLIESEGIVVNNSTTNNYPYLLAPNYKGVNLFTAINILLLKKNKRINLKEETFEIVESESNDVYSNIILSDFGDNQIYEYEKEKTVFDFYNEVIVYGRIHKRVSKNLSSIQKVGRKTLEVYDRKLETQSEVNQRARDLLKLHSESNEKINLTVRQKNISQLRPSDIVNVEIRRENIPLDQYQVLQITHTLDGMMKLQLGKYSKGLEERFAELQLSNAETNASIRTEEQDTNVNSYDFLENINIKPLRVLVRKRENSSSEVLGFANVLGFVTRLGPTGNITLTNLREIDL
jgi:hypothetical protein|tara:strand:+ start:5750 stop:12271 length:6522 start_codon:yes stop_codon:yes gene_type:complete